MALLSRRFEQGEVSSALYIPMDMINPTFECWASSPGQGRINVLECQCRADFIMDDVGFPWDWYPILQDHGELILPSSPKGNTTLDLHVLTTEGHTQAVFEWIVLHMDRLYSNGSPHTWHWKALCSSPFLSYALLNQLSKRVHQKLDWTVLTKRANFLEPKNSLLGVQFVVDNLHLNW
jgi:hypothetical protein